MNPPADETATGTSTPTSSSTPRRPGKRTAEEMALDLINNRPKVKRIVKLVSVFYEGKMLELDLNETTVPRGLIQWLRHLCSLIDEVTEGGFPKEWKVDDDPKNVLGPYTHDELVELVDMYNLVAKPFAGAWAGSYNTGNLGDWGNPHCTSEIAGSIVQLAIEMGIPKVEDLNNCYRAWSSENHILELISMTPMRLSMPPMRHVKKSSIMLFQVYGETNLNQMASILDEVGVTNKDVFIDLGCGIGQLVFFTAAYAQCKKSYGIELNPFPYQLGANVQSIFTKLMKNFGKRFGKNEILEGDLMNVVFRAKISEATVIFINNLLFDAEFMWRLKTEILQYLDEGVKIITTKPLGDPKKINVTDRRIGDLSAISETVYLKSLQGGVSWTDKPCRFYLTTINRMKLMNYFKQKRVMETEMSSKKKKPTKRNRSNDSATSSLDESTLSIPPTTDEPIQKRHAGRPKLPKAIPDVLDADTPSKSRGRPKQISESSKSSSRRRSSDDEDYKPPSSSIRRKPARRSSVLQPKQEPLDYTEMPLLVKEEILDDVKNEDVSDVMERMLEQVVKMV
ncbi:Protein CBG04290 [Caenorhabditis briggsae]|uniref:Histone-lysine N-methyltransferase, H3 lysine-79 specific n=1 Tax=Caenorhabditis briggsae TaxID=6238 RepID=A8WX58_CAEBR|nr:Protein CBG04290 [Caenorhabditis briggsae]CAP25029.2 Protein CBG04290 [Caenorhabditis briggsae]